jgi:hypothetical protein
MKAKKMDRGQFLLQQLLLFSKPEPVTETRELIKTTGAENVHGQAPAPAQRSHLLRWITARRAQGHSFSAIAASLNAKGLRGGYGGRWYGATVRWYLHRHAEKAASADLPGSGMAISDTRAPAGPERMKI